MSDDFASGAFLRSQSQSHSQSQTISAEGIIALARKAIEASRDAVRKSGEGAASTELQQSGVTVNLGSKNIVRLPEEVIDIIKDEIERLAISHNRVSTFPARLAECKRLRYLNVRYNSLKEVPRPVLQLTSLEILDLSRNRLRVLPDGIKNLTSLKVFAIQWNRIERLPLCIGEMSSLVMLKLDDNPLVFPPPDVYNIDADGPSPAKSAEREAHITSRVKKFLRQHNSAQSNRQRLHVDSDGESSEGQVETPRPFRPAGTRFPVKPSLSDLNAITVPSTSPEPPPPIPTRSHQRIISNQSTQSRRPTLLVPPDATTATFNEGSSDVTIRPKRHGIITPRGPEGAAQHLAMSPSALQDAFSNIGSSTHSRNGSVSSAIVAESFIETVKLIHNILFDLCRQLNSIRPMLESQNKPFLKSRIELELRNATNRADTMARCLKRAIGQTKNPKVGFLHRPVLECLTYTALLSREVSLNIWMFTQQSSHDVFRTLFWDVQRDGWEMYVAKTHLSDTIRSATHSRQTSSSSRYAHNFEYGGDTVRNTPINTGFEGRLLGSSNGLEPSPTSSVLTGSTVMTGSAVMTAKPGYASTLSSIPPGQASNQSFSRSNSSMGHDPNISMREEESRQETANDAVWDVVYASLRAVCDRANTELPKIQQHYYGERRKAVRMYDPEHEVVRILGGLVWRTTNLIDASNVLTRKLDTLRVTDKSIRHSQEFWQLCRNLLEEWSTFIDKVKSLGAMSHHAEIKPVMKSIHVVAKETTSRITASPWGSYLHNSGSGNENFTARPPLSSGGSSSANMLQPQSSNMGSIPSTPLSAALGPAALATVPSKGSQSSRSAINFFERADRFAASQQLSHRGPEGLYGRRG